MIYLRASEIGIELHFPKILCVLHAEDEASTVRRLHDHNRELPAGPDVTWHLGDGKWGGSLGFGGDNHAVVLHLPASATQRLPVERPTSERVAAEVVLHRGGVRRHSGGRPIENTAAACKRSRVWARRDRFGWLGLIAGFRLVIARQHVDGQHYQQNHETADAENDQQALFGRCQAVIIGLVTGIRRRTGRFGWLVHRPRLQFAARFHSTALLDFQRAYPSPALRGV
ncbi:MAG: hypothetical protein IPI82_15715 [Candidatus Microthrix sp.]|nr:hypothetical protein [Candidatus Microthrix sp.]MBK7323837.1 hypothetical protein [Candidatus Microthrix sp.]